MPEPSARETPRLLLRQWRDTDYAPFAALNADPPVRQYFPDILTTGQSRAQADAYRSLIDKNGWGLWALEVKRTGEFVGFTGLHAPSATLPFSPCVEVGWRLARDAWGCGYATEAAREAAIYGFEVLGLEEIVSFTAVGNARSRAVMERLGMRFDRNFEHPGLPEGSLLREHCLYRMGRSV